MNGVSGSNILRAGGIGFAALVVAGAGAAAQDECGDFLQTCASVQVGFDGGELQVTVPVWWPDKPIVTFEPETPASPKLPWEPVGGRDVCDRAIPAPECDPNPGAGGQGTPPPSDPPGPPESGPNDDIPPGDLTPVSPPVAPPMSSVPEPISTTLVAVGLAGYGLARRRRSLESDTEEPGTGA